jgi:lipoprotein-releasing system permease protein
VFWHFFKYFSRYILFSKGRQRLLVIAIAGLILSSFSLIVLQSTMGGLQNKLMARSKAILGNATIKVPIDSEAFLVKKIENELSKRKILFTREIEQELLLRYKTFLSPAIVHGVDQNSFIPSYLKNNHFKNGLISMDIAYKIELLPPDEIKLISPTSTDALFLDIPRMQSVLIEKAFSTDVPEIDQFHLWVRLPILQNLAQTHGINRLRIFTSKDLSEIIKILPADFVLKTWEEENSSLVWALKLESSVMLILFASMGILVSLCITSGLLIFFNKVRGDLASFWIMGLSWPKINKLTSIFLHLLTFLSAFMGIFVGLLFLFALKKWGTDIMPEVFVDRKIPVLITLKGILLSLFIPYCISSIFVWLALKQFKKEYDLLEKVRQAS